MNTQNYFDDGFSAGACDRAHGHDPISTSTLPGYSQGYDAGYHACHLCGTTDQHHDLTLHYFSVWYCPVCHTTTRHNDRTSEGRECRVCHSINYRHEEAQHVS